MANARRDLDTTGHTVADHLRRLRQEHNLTPTQMSRRLGELGRPLSPVAVQRMENGERAVDTDDLTALAILFDVSPHRLLMPVAESADAPVAITGAPEMPAERVRGWLGARNSLQDSDPASNTEDLWLIRSNPQWVRLVGDLRPDLSPDVEAFFLNVGRLLQKNPEMARELAQRAEDSRPERTATNDGHR